MEIDILFFLCLASFAAGFVDAIVGGGGLIQTPVALILMPNVPVANIIGSLKIPAFSGTSFAAFQYLKMVKMNWKLLGVMAVVAFASAFAGSTLLTYVSNDFMKPLLLVVLTLLAVYTFMKKNFGQHQEKLLPFKTQLLYALIISITVGFYDGFIGPGTGSFFVVAFVSVLGFDFMHASANAKMVNLATNFGSICLFVLKGKILWAMALPMAVCNALGGFFGAKLAISKGNGFIRGFFLVVVIGTLIRFGYDVFWK
ncbi:putative membrane protein [Flavobacterium limnosediminis JC2902]|uniref:Probable membrane transporter protein n=1 Tax=Flavobacterium limnosediminis JC2902 TaxID=1341181 RepID=V6SR97_9FLAO|nr:TSUP family transporter [Flavobacterium limnosediminis]ESU26955.1 putative membrane protein [Flavobacterium limnosediminis JC2902]